MSVQANPLLKVYDGLYSLLFDGEENPLAEVIKPGNRITFGSLKETDRAPCKESVTSADVPELQLIDEGGLYNPHANSNGMSYQQNFGLYISTGDFRYGVIASLINWYIICNVQNWKTVLYSLKWNDENFVTGLQVIPVQIGESNPERNRNLSGWNCIWRIQIELRMRTGNLTYTESESP